MSQSSILEATQYCIANGCGEDAASRPLMIYTFEEQKRGKDESFSRTPNGQRLSLYTDAPHQKSNTLEALYHEVQSESLAMLNNRHARRPRRPLPRWKLKIRIRAQQHISLVLLIRLTRSPPGYT